MIFENSSAIVHCCFLHNSYSKAESCRYITINAFCIKFHILGIGLTGTSVNPARSLGPAIFAGGAALADLWVFIVGPFVGAVIAALVHKVFEK